MKKKLLLLITIVAVNSGFAQKLEIYYDNPVLRIVPEPTYVFHSVLPFGNHITIQDSVFFDYVSKEVNNLSECKLYCCESEIWIGMIQLILVYDEYNYDVVNMTHSQSSKTIEQGCMELNGKIMEWSMDFQEIMDEIVNYHIVNTLLPIDNYFLTELMNGRRFHLDPYLPPPPPLPKKKTLK